MNKGGAKPKGKVNIKWSPDFAYAVGLIASDGNLSPDGRHIVFTSKDIELAKKFQQSLGISGHIGKKARSAKNEKNYYVVQFSDVLFYRFLETIGLMQKKSRIIGKIKIPKKYFFDFLRGSFDGDGSFYSYWDPRWKSSFMFYTIFVSASKEHVDWLRHEIQMSLGVMGHLTKADKSSVYQLKYAKRESWKVLKNMYYDAKVVCLSRKRLKVERALAIERKGASLIK